MAKRRGILAAVFALALCAGLAGCATAGRPDSTNADATNHPRGPLLLSGHTLYGTTSGETNYWLSGGGAVFKLNTDGTGFVILHHFATITYPNPTNSDGACPMAGLVLRGNTLYGTASEGGSAGCGTVFKVKTDGRDFSVLHSFSGRDGASPLARLVVFGDTLYGTTERGGHNEGVVFKVNTDGAGFAVLHAFTELEGSDLTNRDGAFSQSELVLSGKTLYGTAWSGGPGGVGTIFKVNTDGTGFEVLHGFGRESHDHSARATGHTLNSDGAWLEAGLACSGDTLYGTTSQGGMVGNGTVFKVSTDGGGFTMLHSFAPNPASTGGAFGPNDEGENPQGLIVLGDTLYGMASANGKSGWGTLFRQNTDGTGFTVLHSFGGPGRDGANPRGALTLSGDTLYGTANFGGRDGGGTVFKINTNGDGFTVLHSFVGLPLPPALTD